MGLVLMAAVGEAGRLSPQRGLQAPPQSVEVIE